MCLRTAPTARGTRASKCIAKTKVPASIFFDVVPKAMQKMAVIVCWEFLK